MNKLILILNLVMFMALFLRNYDLVCKIEELEERVEEIDHHKRMEQWCEWMQERSK